MESCKGFQASPSNIRLGLNWMVETKTPAYYCAEINYGCKCFIKVVISTIEYNSEQKNIKYKIV